MFSGKEPHQGPDLRPLEIRWEPPDFFQEFPNDSVPERNGRWQKVPGVFSPSYKNEQNTTNKHKNKNKREQEQPQKTTAAENTRQTQEHSKKNTKKKRTCQRP